MTQKKHQHNNHGRRPGLMTPFYRYCLDWRCRTEREGKGWGRMAREGERGGTVSSLLRGLGSTQPGTAWVRRNPSVAWVRRNPAPPGFDATSTAWVRSNPGVAWVRRNSARLGSTQPGTPRFGGTQHAWVPPKTQP
ncbi:hypothetical protein SLEP1_g57727 [Rubroshorea leprosula]|uniref:Uncharacterized protein n=1 Tax=Rubroshorea leprosula TaxID=152421 RepID=A0AAV5MM19_9ROSI|nr:hypothetical protein SLEP1_g57727 [Rubroshorea leprosula]